MKFRFVIIALLSSCIPTFSADDREEIVVLRCTGDRGPFAGAVMCALKRVGVNFEVMEEAKFRDENVKSSQFVFVPYGARLNQATVDALIHLVEKGGKVFGFYKLPERLADALGVQVGEYIADQWGSRFYSVRFDSNATITGLPGEIVQSSWNIFLTTPVGETRIIGRWHCPDGSDTGYGAVFLSRNGMFMNHVMTIDDIERKGRFLLAIMAQFKPSFWEKSARVLLNRYAKPKMFGSPEKLVQAIAAARRDENVGEERANGAEMHFVKSKEMRMEAQRELLNGHYYTAFEYANMALKEMEYAQLMLMPSRKREFRAVFVASPYPAPGWDAVCQAIANSNFNAVIPYMGSAGMAFYESEVVPRHVSVKFGRDALTECIKAAHACKLKVHAWIDILNVTHAPAKLIDELKHAKRVVEGTEPGAQLMLCPAELKNRKLAVAMCEELVKKYEVDGVMMDYLRLPFSPTTDYCYCEHCKDRFVAEMGINNLVWPKDVMPQGRYRKEFEAWRLHNITSLLNEIRNSIRNVGAKVALSVATFGWADARFKVSQDAQQWAKMAIVDFSLFMNYTNSTKLFDRMVAAQVSQVGKHTPVYAAIGAFSHAAQFDDVFQLVEQIQITRSRGAAGFAIYKMNETLMREFLPALRLGVTYEP